MRGFRVLVGTHTLMPVCACLLADNVAIGAGRDRIFPARCNWVVGFFGILPDICTPHLSLEDRHASWSHTVWFMAGLILVVAMAGTFFDKGYRIRVAMACWGAAALHLASDAVSGGIVLFYPWRPDVIGRYFIPAQHWMWFDAFFVILAWFLIRVLPHLEARNIRVSRLTSNS